MNNKLWIYDQDKIKWFYSSISNQNNLEVGFAFTAIYHYERLYLCGGVK